MADKIKLPKVDKREHNALICALRYWQAEGCPDFHELGSNAGEDDVLDEKEVDDLVENLNCL